MRYSAIFAKTRKTAPSDEATINAKLLVQAGFVNKLMAGVYSYLPLGLRVLLKIENIVREEMNAIGGQEVLLPALHPVANWKKTGAWESVDVLFKIKSRTGKDYALGQSHEEVITPLVRGYCDSYKNFPLFVYQIQNKFRDELRAKSGVLRGREFGMKDMYSFNLTQKGFDKFYEKAKKAYLRVYDRCGLTAKVTEASGGGFSEKISYEFMVLTEAGEDDILYCENCDYCVNLEIAKVKKGGVCPACGKGNLKKARASEVGNVFDLGDKYSKDFNFSVLDKRGQKAYPIMGCYGIGTTRLVGVIVEKYHDDMGITWPEAVAPFKAYLINIGDGEKTGIEAEKIYNALTEKGVEVLWDDRIKVGAGQKFADSDLIGLPYRLVISPETIQKGKIEVKKREQKEISLMTFTEFLKKIG